MSPRKKKKKTTVDKTVGFEREGWLPLKKKDLLNLEGKGGGVRMGAETGFPSGYKKLLLRIFLLIIIIKKTNSNKI